MSGDLRSLVASLRELMAKATPGPWDESVRFDGAGLYDITGNPDNDAHTVDMVAQLLSPEDAALLVAAINALPKLLDALSLSDEAVERADAMRYRYLRDHHGSHYGMDMAEPSPAEWSISWDFQQSRPGEQFSTFDSLIDADIARLDEDQRAALATALEGGKT